MAQRMGGVMRHGRGEYDHIQDDRGVIGDDEPVFLVRAKDLLAPSVIEAWASLAEERGAPARAASARAWANEVRAWQETNATQYPMDA
jgi:hypothetical protein